MNKSLIPPALRKRASAVHRPFAGMPSRPATCSLPLALLITLAAVSLLCLLLLLIAALILTRQADPTPLIAPIALTITALGAILGSLLLRRLHPSAPIPTILTFLACYALLVFLAGGM